MSKSVGFSIVVSFVNVPLLGFLIVRDWQLCVWPFTCDLYRGPHTFSDLTFSLQLGLLQATLVAIGVGLTIMGVISFRSIQDAAKETARETARESAEKTAEDVARETARETAEKTAREAARETAEDVAKEVAEEMKSALTAYLNQAGAAIPKSGAAATVSIPVESELEREE